MANARQNSRRGDILKNGLHHKAAAAADGISIGGRNSNWRALAIRTEVGRLSLPRLSRRRRERFAIKEWAAARSLLS